MIQDNKALDSYIWHPFTQHGLERPPIKIARASGSYLFTTDHRQLIDAISSWWVITHGHCYPPLVHQIQKYCGQLDQLIFAGCTHEAAEQVVQGLRSFLPSELAYVFFSDSGSTSVEVALKMALGYWRNSGSRRNKIIALEDAYHGDTIGGMSLGARSIFNHSYEPLLFQVHRLPFPTEGAEQVCYDHLEAVCRQGDVAALIVEPLILGAGGMKIYTPQSLAMMAEICRRYQVLLIADEVMTGWGRTGKIFACEHAKIIPDILCSSKGLTGGMLPLAITVCRPEIFEAHRSENPANTFFHSSSYTANPIACWAAVANMAVWREEPVLERIALLEQWQEEFCNHFRKDAQFSNVRRIGTITAMELAQVPMHYGSKQNLALRRFFLESGIVLRPLGRTLYVLPPYSVEYNDLKKIYEVLAQATDFCLRSTTYIPIREHHSNAQINI